jgi:hypothetical protein
MLCIITVPLPERKIPFAATINSNKACAWLYYKMENQGFLWVKGIQYNVIAIM